MTTLLEKPKLLLVGDSCESAEEMLSVASESHEIVAVQNPMRALSMLTRERFAGVFVTAKYFQEAFQIGKLLQNEQILEGMPDGVALLESDNTIVWANSKMRQWSGRDSISGLNFYAALGSPEILGPDFCPFHTALATGQGTSSTLRSEDNRYFQVQAAPVHELDGPSQAPDHHRPRRDARGPAAAEAGGHPPGGHGTGRPHAGGSLPDADPRPDRAAEIEHHPFHQGPAALRSRRDPPVGPQDRTGSSRCWPRASIPDAAMRDLFALPQGNGVTGFVAATGKSYLCEDTTEDPLFLEGVRGAKSSLTVPLLLHDEVIGTFNVESMEPRAFSESDLQFLEIFSRDVAAALNTLELLVAEKANTAAESVEAIHSAVALPIDEILNEAVNVMERYIGHEPEVVERLQRILRNARDIKQVIQKVGQTMAPGQAHPVTAQVEDRPLLHDRRVLFVDADGSIRGAAHTLLDRYRCEVETAHDGAEALCMVRARRPARPTT